MKLANRYNFIIRISLCLFGLALVYLVLSQIWPALNRPVLAGLALLVLGAGLCCVSFFLLPRLNKLDQDFPALEKDRNALLEYIDAIWMSHKKFIQQEKLEALNTLVAGIAHEINTPLGSAITAISYLEEMAKATGGLDVEGAKIKDILDLSMRNLRKASALVVNFKKISAQKVEGENEVQSVRSLLSYLINLSRNRAINPNVSVVLDCGKELFFNISFSSFSVIIDNVLENALQHAYAEGQRGEVKIIVENTQNDLRITIADDGNGMPAEIVEQIFNPFYTTSRQTGHYGLGLSIAYNLVFRQFNGEIICESVVGKGSRFVISLPDILMPDPANCLAV